MNKWARTNEENGIFQETADISENYEEKWLRKRWLQVFEIIICARERSGWCANEI